MTELKREKVKYIRDFIKKDYKLNTFCFVCGAAENLELHHLFSVSELFNTWCDKNKVTDINTVELMNTVREQFASDCSEKLANDNLYTLCGKHHKQLHNIYGQRYSNSMAPKILNWLNIQKDKHGSG